MIDIPIQIRPARPADMGFVQDTWLKAAKWSPLYRDVPFGAYKAGMRATIGALLARPHIFVLLAVDPESPDDHRYGWIVAEHDALHYVYVHDVYRRAHVALRLATYVFPAFGQVPTPTTATGPGDPRTSMRDVRKMSKRYQLVFDPFRLFTVKGRAA